MNKRERVDAASAGRDVDQVPVAAWRHFVDQESNAADLARAMVRWVRDYDWDFLKINPRATYAVEAWGNQYDFGRYEGVGPTLVSHAVSSVADLSTIKPLDPGSGPFGEQLDAVRRIVGELGDEMHAIQTIFSPLSYLVRLMDAPDAAARIREMEAADPAAFKGALEAIASTLAAYAAEVVRAGASGIFYAVVRLAREGQLTRDEYRRLGRPGDLRVLEAARGAPFNLLHVCGEGIYLDEFADYPVQAVNWDVLGKGNPSLAEGQRVVPFAVVGGTGEAGLLQTGTPEQVTRLVRDAIRSTGGRRVMIAPGCSAKPPQSEENLRALRRAVDQGLGPWTR